MMVPSKARTKIGPKVLKLAKTICKFSKKLVERFQMQNMSSFKH